MTERTSFLRLASQWLIGFLLAGVLTALFVLIAAVQLSSEETGTRAHRRSVATLTEIDRLIPGIEADLDLTDATSDETVQVPRFPFPVLLTADEARTLRGAALRERMLDSAAALLYEDGMEMWAAADPDAVQRIDRVSTTGALETGMGLVSDSWNTKFVIIAVLLGVLSLLLTAGLMLTVHDWNMRFVALGSVIIAAGLPCLAAAIGIRFAFNTAKTDADSFVTDMLDLGIDSVWVAIRDYLTISALGFVVAGLGALGAWLQGRAARSERITATPSPK